MLASKVSVSEETKNKSKLNVFQKGALRFEKLKNADNNGTLTAAKNRIDVAYICGYPEEQKGNGYAWVSRMIRQGVLAETVRYFDNGKAINEYHTTGKEPDYSFSAMHSGKKAKKAKKVEEVKEPVILSRVAADTVEVVLSENGRTICVKGLSDNGAIELVKTIWNK